MIGYIYIILKIQMNLLQFLFQQDKEKFLNLLWESFVKDVRKDLRKTFNNDDFEKEKQIIKQEYEEKRENLLKKLNQKTMIQGFQVSSTDNGVYMMPVFRW